MEPWDALGLIDMALSCCRSLHQKFQTMKGNRQLCEDLAKKVRALQDLVGTINRFGQIQSHVCRALKALCENLASANGIMAKFYNISPVLGFLKSDSIKEKFSCVDKKLGDSLQILSTALQVQHGKVLDLVYETVSERSPYRRLPIPDFQISRSPPAACYSGPMAPTVAAMPSMVPTSPVMVPLVFPGAPTTGSFSTTTTTFVSRGVSSAALKAALKSIPQINMEQIYAAGLPAGTVRCSLLPSKSRLRKR